LLAYAGGPKDAGGCAWQAGIRARGSVRRESHRGHRLPTGVRPQWHWDGRVPAYRCGGSAGLRALADAAPASRL